MVKLNTPSHQCQQVINGPSGRVRCPYGAYRRVNGAWYCRTDARRHRKHTSCITCH